VPWREAGERGGPAAVREVRPRAEYEAWYPEFADSGLAVPTWPVPYGGLGLRPAQARVVDGVLAPYHMGRLNILGLNNTASALFEHGTEEQRLRFLPPMVRNEEIWCQLFSEPGAGSDLASLATTAVRDGEEWVLNGQKVWTTYGHESEMAMVLARTDPTSAKHQGITYFGLDMRAPGVEVRPLRQMTGEVEFNEVFLSDVRVPELFRISPVGQGWGATQTTLGAERHALSGTGRKRKASDEILGGKTIADVVALARSVELSPARREDVVRAWMASRVLELTIARSKARAAAGHTPGPEGSLTKVAKAKVNQELQVLAVALLGARATAWDDDDREAPGYLRELLRTRANSIEGGTSEIQRNIVGERVLGLPREPDPYKGSPWKDVPRS
jgi:alkylation response protein AidB-like acyl-CoA dehydrogenase